MNFKKSTLLVALLAITIGSCTKKYETNVPYVPPYHLDGITDLTVNADNPSASMQIGVTYQNSNQERVTLSLEGMPAGLTYNIINPSGYPSFSSFISFFDSSAAIGTYTVNLVAKGDKSGKVKFPFTVMVTEIPDCAAGFTGANFSASNFCTSGSYTEGITLLSANHVQFTNFEGTGVHLNATFNCTTGDVTIPTQTINGFIYAGSGSFGSFGTNQEVVISYSKQPVGGGSTINCEEDMFR